MYSTLRSPLFSEKKITIIYTAIYRKKKAFHKAFGKMTVFFIPNRASESSQRRLCLSVSKALPDRNGVSVSSSPPENIRREKKQLAEVHSKSATVHSHPHTTTPLASHTQRDYLYRKF